MVMNTGTPSKGWGHQLAATLLVVLALMLPRTVSAQADITGNSAMQSQSYRDGMADRITWETWYGALAGADRDGATYWASHRSVAHPGTCQPPPGTDASAWMAACKTAQQRLNPIDVRRKTEPDYRAGFNTYLPANPAAAPPPEASASLSAPAGAVGGRISIGEHAGEDAAILAQNGIGTEHATVSVNMDWSREVHACQEGHSDDNKAGLADCLDYARKNFKGATVLMAWANCRTGELQSFGGGPNRFYVGQIKQNYTDNGGEHTYFEPIFHYEGFTVGNYAYTGTGHDGEIFRDLCPAAFTGPPTQDLPELDLSADCKKLLPDAEATAVEAGPA
jgi:hypothetical protein